MGNSKRRKFEVNGQSDICYQVMAVWPEQGRRVLLLALLAKLALVLLLGFAYVSIKLCS